MFIRMKLILMLSGLPAMSQVGIGQKMIFEYEKVPKESGFKMEGYWIWCGSLNKVGSNCQMICEDNMGGIS